MTSDPFRCLCVQIDGVADGSHQWRDHHLGEIGAEVEYAFHADSPEITIRGAFE
jgi:hypothetical protein